MCVMYSSFLISDLGSDDLREEAVPHPGNKV